MPKEAFYAHSVKGRPKTEWQTLIDHLSGVSKRAGEFALKFGFTKAGEMAGLLHDLGKYSDPYCRRLEGGPSVDHSTAGSVVADQMASTAKTFSDAVIAHLLSYVVAGHHAGMPDHVGPGSVADRTLRGYPTLLNTWKDEVEIDSMGLFGSLLPPSSRDRMPFQVAFLGRMLFSCLVDADHLDTESFYASVEGRKLDRPSASLKGRHDEFDKRLTTYLEMKLKGRSPRPLDVVRNEILEAVRIAAAAYGPGVFTLTVPTSGGKTLASLRFAIDHARTHDLDRIVYVAPFTSVVDQTASVLREAMGEENVLEHHSSFDDDTAPEGYDKIRAARQNWAVPVIATTAVQFFESLFSAKPGRCRKLHNLARSVVILDEAQTLPLDLLRPCIAALDELALNYGASVVLCTATQPAVTVPRFEGGFSNTKELAPDPTSLFKKLRRTTLSFAGVWTDEDALTEASRHQRVMTIVNTREHALALHRQAIEKGMDGVRHLSTRQCAAHRAVILTEIRNDLATGRTCRLFATSIVEAGVDVDFGAVLRAEAGLDQIAQAAGRCNREGLRSIEDSPVTVFTPQGRDPPWEIRQAVAAFRRMTGRYEDLFAPEAMEEFYREVYFGKSFAGNLDQLVVKGPDGSRQGVSLFSMFDIRGRRPAFSYRTVGNAFRMIDSPLAPIITPFGFGFDEILERFVSGETDAGSFSRSMQRYVVPVPERDRTRMISAGSATLLMPDVHGKRFCILVERNLYDEETGLSWG